MKKKLINALKTKYADKGFNQTDLEGLADILAKNLNEEATDEEISNAVGGASDYVELMQKVGNRYASQIERKYAGYTKPEPAATAQAAAASPETKANGQGGAGTAAGLTLEQVSELLSTKIADALKPFQEAQQAQKLSDLLASQPKLKAIPQKFVSRYKLQKEEDAETLAAQIEQDFANERKEMLATLGLSDVPFGGGGGFDTDDDFAKKMQEAQKALAKKD